MRDIRRVIVNQGIFTFLLCDSVRKNVYVKVGARKHCILFLRSEDKLRVLRREALEIN